MKRIIWLLAAVLLLCAGCAAPQGELSDAETIAFDMANTYFTWSLASLGEEFFVEYETEVNVKVEGVPCYGFIARTDTQELCYAAVTQDGQTLYIRFSDQAEWEEVSQQIWDAIDESYQP